MGLAAVSSDVLRRLLAEGSTRLRESSRTLDHLRRFVTGDRICKSEQCAAEGQEFFRVLDVDEEGVVDDYMRAAERVPEKELQSDEGEVHGR